MDETEVLLSTDSAAVAMVLRGPNRPDLLREECLADILIASARRRPHHPALVWGKRVVTYRELDASSQAVAGALGNRGAAAGQVLGLFMPRGADLLIAQAGITRSGAAWLPFDAEAPPARVKMGLESAQACGLVTCRAWLPRLAELSVSVWAIEDLLAEGDSTLPCAGAKPSDPALTFAVAWTELEAQLKCLRLELVERPAGQTLAATPCTIESIFLPDRLVVTAATHSPLA